MSAIDINMVALKPDVQDLKVPLVPHEFSDGDSDTVDENQLMTLFNKPCELVAETQYGTNYVLHLTGNVEGDPMLAAGLSNRKISILKYSDSGVANIAVLSEQNSKIIGASFSPENSSLLYSGQVDNDIKLWDLRTPEKSVTVFKDSSTENVGNVRPFTCFDISPNNRLLAAGTELYEGDAYILFWDVRNTKLMGGYWESHTDDITQVKFHPSDVNRLISGSTDGLINIYDLCQHVEEDALIDTLNTESSIEQLAWFRAGHCDAISCVTHTTDLQLWRTDDCEPFITYHRADIASIIKRSTENYIYISGIHSNWPNAGLVILAGSNFNDGECIRGILMKSYKVFLPSFSLCHNTQRIRSSWNNINGTLLVTGGEKGIVQVWKTNLFTDR